MICEHLQECCADEQYICANKGKCVISWDRRPQVVCKERGKKYNLVNDEQYPIALFHMDGGILRDEKTVSKCDFLYVIYDPNCPTAIFVELKGKDIKHAVDQLNASLERYGKAMEKRRICARIICSSVPRLFNDPIVKKLKRKLAGHNKGNLVIFEKSKDEKYSSI